MRSAFIYLARKRSTGLLAFLLLQSFPVSAQMSDEPYCHIPVSTPTNNRHISDRRMACLYEKYGVKACSTVVVKTYPGSGQTDSSLTSYAAFHTNGFVDFTYNYTTKRNFKYTLAGGRVISEMIAGCGNDSLLTVKGPANGETQTQHPIYSRVMVTRFFDASGYLRKKKEMAKGLLKHENSIDGSWNHMCEVRIDSSGNLLELTEYLSHWWFFRAPERKYIFRYDAKGLLSEKTEITYTGRKILSTEKSKYSYLFRE